MRDAWSDVREPCGGGEEGIEDGGLDGFWLWDLRRLDIQSVIRGGHGGRMRPAPDSVREAIPVSGGSLLRMRPTHGRTSPLLHRKRPKVALLAASPTFLRRILLGHRNYSLALFLFLALVASPRPRSGRHYDSSLSPSCLRTPREGPMTRLFRPHTSPAPYKW